MIKDKVASYERYLILEVLKGNKFNKTETAKTMGISRECLRKKLLVYIKPMEPTKIIEKEVPLC